MQNQLSSTSNLGGTATILLPFQVEPEMVICEPNLESGTCSVNLYVVLKKVFKTKDKLVTNKMTLKVSNGIRKSDTGSAAYLSNYQKTSTSTYVKVEKENNGYSSSGSSTSSVVPPKKILKSV
jgi:hypothetical protein